MHLVTRALTPERRFDRRVTGSGTDRPAWQRAGGIASSFTPSTGYAAPTPGIGVTDLAQVLAEPTSLGPPGLDLSGNA